MRNQYEAIWDTLAEDEKRVLSALAKEHVGIDSAISMPDLTAKAGVSSTRRLQQIVKDLVEIYGVRIGSGVANGFFIIETADEAHRVAQNFWKRAFSNIRHAQAIERMSVAGTLDKIAGLFDLEKNDNAA